MSHVSDSMYSGREQTLIKHTILQKYLERFALIVGQFYDAITYVDGFSGPWECKSETLDDTSFSIVLQQLQNAQKAVKEKFNRDLKIRCFFVEKDKSAFVKLKAFAETQTANVEIVVKNGEFEAQIGEIIDFIHRGPSRNFPFVFIDPTGWKGFAMGVISPLIKLQPCEVLINFMMSHIRRFIKATPSEIAGDFEQLYGDPAFRNRFDGLLGQQREDAIVFSYAERLGIVGGYPYVPVTLVADPKKNIAQFYLVYATRNLKGLEVFKAAERQALQLVGPLRADAKLRKRIVSTRQTEMFQGNAIPDTNYTDQVRSRYLSIARERVCDLLNKEEKLPYDMIFALALRYPFVFKQDLDLWLDDYEIDGLKPREQVAKFGKGHVIRVRPQFI